MGKFSNLLRQPAFHGFLFGFFLLLLGWPLLTILGGLQGMTVFLYLFLVWGLIILMGALICASLRGSDTAGSSENKEV